MFATVRLPSRDPSLPQMSVKPRLGPEHPRPFAPRSWGFVAIQMCSRGTSRSLRPSQPVVVPSPVARSPSRLCTILIFTLILCMWLGRVLSVTEDRFAAGMCTASTPSTFWSWSWLWGLQDYEDLTRSRPYTKDDEPGNTKFPAGPNGDHMCDAPFSLERSMYDAINKFVPDAAFTIFTGDIVDHAIWNTSQQYNTNLSTFIPIPAQPRLLNRSL